MSHVPRSSAHVTPDPDADFTDAPSRTQRKREVEALQDLGRQLTELGKDQLVRIPLPDDLRKAIQDWQRFTQHGAKRRQLQYIGRLMRKTNPDPIEAGLAEVRGESATAKAHFHSLERWRTRLLEQPDALTAWLGEYPRSDAQQLRALIRNAAREAATGKPPKSSRELFKVLRGIMEDGSTATAASNHDGPEGADQIDQA